MIIRPFKRDDWYVDKPLEIVEMNVDVETLEKRSIAVSVHDDRGCAGCGGIILWEDDEAEAWLRLSERIVERPIALLRAIKESHYIIKKVHKGSIFCWVDDSWPEAQRLVAWFGGKRTDTTKEFNNKIYRLWDLDDGSSTNGSRAGSISSRTDTAG